MSVDEEPEFLNWLLRVIGENLPSDFDIGNVDLTEQMKPGSSYEVLFQAIVSNPDSDLASVYEYVRQKRFCDVLASDIKSGRVVKFPQYESNIKGPLKQRYFVSGFKPDEHFIRQLMAHTKQQYEEFQDKLENACNMVENRFCVEGESMKVKYDNLFKDLETMGLSLDRDSDSESELSTPLPKTKVKRRKQHSPPMFTVGDTVSSDFSSLDFDTATEVETVFSDGETDVELHPILN
ncbi:unnamed protein product [Bursaphelenchus okinawaensis]|uniref:Uncharacterized protein n=1 Tax=Bursaphelenchus okinawaensis TaxID=465554 RepID=A0A811JRH1_9BILA|nr:unnamed protein product [Bursaphelenchus okinawaensis]CAG9079171.1 unnamed protein product [Bursaphelenchus okinawaensis]